MGRTFTTLATGDPESDRANVVELHFENTALRREVEELKAQNHTLKIMLKRLTATEADHSTGKVNENES